MNTFTLAQIFIYPVKSLAGISLQSAKIEERGLKYDRRWMLVDESNQFITQRAFPQLALINTEIKSDSLTLSHKQNKLPAISLPIIPNDLEEVKVQVWKDNVPAQKYGNEIRDWLSEITGINTSLVFMPESTKRTVDQEYAINKAVSFADAFPFLIIGEESLNELNRRMENPLSINRFRTNFFFSGGEAFDEDKWDKIKIGNVDFNVVKSCARCAITTVDQNTGEKGNEPLAALAKFRKENGKVMFGQNMAAENAGTVSIGDKINTPTILP
jgi:uncharacterized protein YcbX